MITKFIIHLIATAIPVGGLIYMRKKDKQNEEKMDILYGKTCDNIIKASGVLYENNKNEKVDLVGEVDLAREHIRCAFYRLEDIIDDVDLSFNDKNRLLEHYGTLKNIAIPSFKNQCIQAERMEAEKTKTKIKEMKEYDNYGEKFLRSYPKINIFCETWSLK